MQSLRLTPALRQSLSPRLLQALRLVQLPGPELAEALAEAAAGNPFLRLDPPGPRAGAALPDPDQAEAAPGLHAHILAQPGLWPADPAEAALARAFLEALEPTGWLGRSPEEIAAELGCPPAAALRVLDRLQQVEPAGLFARDLAECLRLQAADRDELTPAMAAVLAHLGALAAGGPEALAACTGLPPAAVERCLARLRRMDPKPGLAFAADTGPLREPDLVASLDAAGRWTVELNRSALPALTLEAPEGAAGPLRPALAEARWLLRAVEERGRTLLAIGAEVVARQSDYLAGRTPFLTPLRLAAVAEARGLHPSTVSRAVNGLLIASPRGLVAVRRLFAAPTSAGGVSAGAVCARLGRLIAGEDPARPLDDDALARLLGAEGIALARRTVAKYRTELGLPPAAARRRPAPPPIRPATAAKEMRHV